MITVAQSAPFEATFESGLSGLIPGLEVAIIDGDGNVVQGPLTSNLAEEEIDGNPTGVYVWNSPAAPGDLGQYTIVWSTDGTFFPRSVSVEDLVVLTEEEASAALPPIPTDPDGGLMYGPCTSWITIPEIAGVCDLPESSNPIEMIPDLERAAASASQFLWAASGRQFSGICQRTVRPCRIGCDCNWQVLSRGHVVAPPSWSDVGYSWHCNGDGCGCTPISEVKLAGYPVREILSVTIDGDPVDAGDYELRDYRFLVRLGNERWPSCQNMGVSSTEDGSFSVTYTFGQAPPQIGRDAAAQLACEIMKASLDLECALPVSARRIVRNGITIDATYFNRDETGVWRTGLPYVDMFLAGVNPSGLTRRPTIWAPGRRYPRGA